jgi:UDP-N-acetylglucosamine 2-epimerase
VKTKAVLWILQQHEPKIAREVVTFDIGQHYSPDLSDSVVKDLDFSFTYRLGPENGQVLRGAILGRALSELSIYFDRIASRPTVVVFGDASSAVAGAFAAYNAQLPLVHIEAGARRDPTELEHNNSIIVDQLADIRLAYTCRAMTSLRGENLGAGTHLVGDVAYDWYRSRYGNLLHSAQRGTYAPILVSMHRPANMTNDTIMTVAEALLATGREVRWLSFPRTRPFLASVAALGVRIVEPLPHSGTMVELSNAGFLLTDSGGLSREAHYVGCPVLMRRDLGGWPELAQAGFLYPLRGRSRAEVDAAIRWAETVALPGPEKSPMVVPDGGKEIARLVVMSARGEL